MSLSRSFSVQSGLTPTYTVFASSSNVFGHISGEYRLFNSWLTANRKGSEAAFSAPRFSKIAVQCVYMCLPVSIGRTPPIPSAAAKRRASASLAKRKAIVVPQSPELSLEGTKAYLPSNASITAFLFRRRSAKMPGSFFSCSRKIAQVISFVRYSVPQKTGCRISCNCLPK